MDDILNDFESPPPASKFTRWLASFIDYLIFALLAGIMLYFIGDRSMIKMTEENAGLFNDIIGIVLIVIPWLVVLPGYETFNKGQTIGKAIMEIRVLKHDGAKLDIVSSIVRHLFDFIDFLPFGGLVGIATAASNKKGQRVGDLVAKTIVIESGWNG